MRLPFDQSLAELFQTVAHRGVVDVVADLDDQARRSGRGRPRGAGRGWRSSIRPSRSRRRGLLRLVERHGRADGDRPAVLPAVPDRPRRAQRSAPSRPSRPWRLSTRRKSDDDRQGPALERLDEDPVLLGRRPAPARPASRRTSGIRPSTSARIASSSSSTASTWPVLLGGVDAAPRRRCGRARAPRRRRPVAGDVAGRRPGVVMRRGSPRARWPSAGRAARRSAASTSRRWSSSAERAWPRTLPATETARSAAFDQISDSAWSRAVAMSRSGPLPRGLGLGLGLLDDLVGRGLRVRAGPCRASRGPGRPPAASCRRCSASRCSLSFRARSVSSRTCSRCSSRWCSAASSGFQANLPSTNSRPRKTTTVQMASDGWGSRMSGSAASPARRRARPRPSAVIAAGSRRRPVGRRPWAAVGGRRAGRPAARAPGPGPRVRGPESVAGAWGVASRLDRVG